MNKLDAEEVVYDLTDNLYWDMADSLDDEGQGKLDDLVEDFRKKGDRYPNEIFCLRFPAKDPIILV